ncbi:MAG: DUF2799 domain-containing protein [Gammaproteobacteria bacterium]
MIRVYFLLLTISSALALSGCASMSAEECHTADWRTIGFEDGAQGRTADSIRRHRKACAKAGVTADQAAYENGRQSGLRSFCQPGRGYDLGRNGGRYQGVCPADLEATFLQAYEEGRYLYDLEQAVREVENQIQATDRDLATRRDDLAAGERELIDGVGDRSTRSALVDNNRELAQTIAQLELEREQLLIELGVRRAALADYAQ